MNNNYAIETSGLIKRYPTARDDSGALYGSHSSTDSALAIPNAFRNKEFNKAKAFHGLQMKG